MPGVVSYVAGELVVNWLYVAYYAAVIGFSAEGGTCQRRAARKAQGRT